MDKLGRKLSNFIAQALLIDSMVVGNQLYSILVIKRELYSYKLMFYAFSGFCVGKQKLTKAMMSIYN